MVLADRNSPDSFGGTLEHLNWQEVTTLPTDRCSLCYDETNGGSIGMKKYTTYHCECGKEFQIISYYSDVDGKLLSVSEHMKTFGPTDSVDPMYKRILKDKHMKFPEEFRM